LPPEGVAGAWGATNGAVVYYSTKGYNGGIDQLGKRLCRTFWRGLLLGLLGGAVGRFGNPINPVDRALGNLEGKSGWDMLQV